MPRKDHFSVCSVKRERSHTRGLCKSQLCLSGPPHAPTRPGTDLPPAAGAPHTPHGTEPPLGGAGLGEDPAQPVASKSEANVCLFFCPALLQKTQIKALLFIEMTPYRAAVQAQLCPMHGSLPYRAPSPLPASPLPYSRGRAEHCSPSSAPRAASPRCFTTALLQWLRSGCLGLCLAPLNGECCCWGH